MFKHIAVAIDFSPHMEAMLAQAQRISLLYEAVLSIIHIGKDDQQEKKRLREAVQQAGIEEQKVKIFWEDGEPVEKIVAIAREQGVDLLMTAANKKKNLLEYYTGSVARDMLRNAPCSVLLLVRPGKPAVAFKNIVIKAGELEESRKSIPAGCRIGQKERANQLQIIKQVKLYGFTMSVASEGTVDEYQETKEDMFEEEIEEVEQVLKETTADRLPIEVKVVKEKYGPALTRITKKSKADLLLLAAPEEKPGLLAKVFTTDLEYLLKDLPCNLMMIKAN